jgi:uncharacterized membrane protein
MSHESPRPLDVVASSPPAAPQHKAAEWGLASLVLAAALLLMAPLLLASFAAAVGVHFRDWRNDTLPGFLMFLAGILCMLPLYVTALIAGIVGVRSALKQKSPVGLALCGMLTSVVAGFLWLFVVIHVIGSLVSMF